MTGALLSRPCQLVCTVESFPVLRFLCSREERTFQELVLEKDNEDDIFMCRVAKGNGRNVLVLVKIFALVL